MDELLPLVKQLAPDAAVWAAVLVYVVRAVRKELAEQRTSRAATATVGARVGALEAELAGLRSALTLQAISRTGRPADVDEHLADDYDDYDDPPTAAARVAVPPIPSYPRHSRRSA